MRLRTLAVVPLAVRHRRPAPGTPALTSGALSARYAADAQAIGTAERAAAGDGDSQLAGALASLRTQHVLFFDPRGQGVAAMVIGNQATAARVAILVPGSDTTLATFFSPGSGVSWRRRGGARRQGTSARARDAAGDHQPRTLGSRTLMVR